MKTSITNRIRSVIDALPASIRDARWFMWSFFFVWFRGENVKTAMEFKRLAPAMTDAEFRDVYARVRTLADQRVTDTNAEAMEYAISRLDPGARSLLDVGCGQGFFLSKLAERVTRSPGHPVAQSHPPPGDRETGRPGDRSLKLAGCDLLGGDVHAVAERLPFKTGAFDVVTCFHTLEHTRDLAAAVAELKRVARKQLVVIVPRQRRFFYTLDLHLQFFPDADALRAAMGGGGEIRQFGSDLVYISAP